MFQNLFVIPGFLGNISCRTILAHSDAVPVSVRDERPVAAVILPARQIRTIQAPAVFIERTAADLDAA